MIWRHHSINNSPFSPLTPLCLSHYLTFLSHIQHTKFHSIREAEYISVHSLSIFHPTCLPSKPQPHSYKCLSPIRHHCYAQSYSIPSQLPNICLFIHTNFRTPCKKITQFLASILFCKKNIYPRPSLNPPNRKCTPCKCLMQIENRKHACGDRAG